MRMCDWSSDVCSYDLAIYFHTLGTDQAQDRLVFSTPDRPRLNSVAEITDDGNWLLVTSSEGTDDRYELTAIDLTSARMVKRVIVRGLENHWSLAGNLGSIFYRSEEHTSELQSLMRNSYAVFCLKKKKQ